MVALLRGVNVGGNKKVPMAELRALAAKLGWRDVATYVQSGNLVGSTELAAPAAAAQLSRAIAKLFGFEVPVVARVGSAFVRDLAACPFADDEPARVHVGYANVAPKSSLPKLVAAYCTMGERVAVRGGVLWIDFVGGVARSKLTSAVLDRAVGGTVTLRNLNSARAIAALVDGGKA
jgi:uncharacterized protein (DUF1697 family)